MSFSHLITRSSRHILTVLFVSFINLNMTSSRLITRPRDGAHALLTLVRLQCETDNNTNRLDWTFLGVGKSVSQGLSTVFLEIITQAGEQSSSAPSRYIFRPISSNRFDLVISSVKASDAGLYTCRENGGFGDKATAQVVVIAAITPTCDLIDDNNIGSKAAAAMCQVKYIGNGIPKFIWRKYINGSLATLQNTLSKSSLNVGGLIAVTSRISIDKLIATGRDETSMITCAIIFGSASLLSNTAANESSAVRCNWPNLITTETSSIKTTFQITKNDEILIGHKQSSSSSMSSGSFVTRSQFDTYSNNNIESKYFPMKNVTQEGEFELNEGHSTAVIENISSPISSTKVISTLTLNALVVTICVLVFVLVLTLFAAATKCSFAKHRRGNCNENSIDVNMLENVSYHARHWKTRSNPDGELSLSVETGGNMTVGTDDVAWSSTRYNVPEEYAEGYENNETVLSAGAGAAAHIYEKSRRFQEQYEEIRDWHINTAVLPGREVTRSSSVKSRQAAVLLATEANSFSGRHIAEEKPYLDLKFYSSSTIDGDNKEIRIATAETRACVVTSEEWQRKGERNLQAKGRRDFKELIPDTLLKQHINNNVVSAIHGESLVSFSHIAAPVVSVNSKASKVKTSLTLAGDSKLISKGLNLPVRSDQLNSNQTSIPSYSYMSNRRCFGLQTGSL